MGKDYPGERRSILAQYFLFETIAAGNPAIIIKQVPFDISMIRCGF
jgi:hypothetical protein